MEWDFHQETKGMKYEHISQLTSQLEPDLEDLRCSSVLYFE